MGTASFAGTIDGQSIRFNEHEIWRTAAPFKPVDKFPLEPGEYDECWRKQGDIGAGIKILDRARRRDNGE